MNLGDLVFLLSVPILLVLSVRVLFGFVRGGFRRARVDLILISSWLIVYVSALAAASLSSETKLLAQGDEKCFDEWCVSVTKSVGLMKRARVHFQVSNHGRGRPQRPDNPEMFEIVDGTTVPIYDPRLFEAVAPGSPQELGVELQFPESAHTVDFLVTEGGWPTKIIINNENSPFHAKSVWRIKPSGIESNVTEPSTQQRFSPLSYQSLNNPADVFFEVMHRAPDWTAS